MWTLLLNKYVLGGALAFVLIAGAYTKGHMDATANCHEASLRAEIAVLHMDLQIAKAAASDAKNRADYLDKQHFEANTKLQEYENELAKRKDDTCGLSDGDLQRLRGIYGPN